jgi:hypothetical protein
VRHIQMDAKTSSMSTLALIAIPRRATTADLVQTVIANDAARRSHQGITSASTIRRSATTAAEQGSGGVSGGNVLGPLVSAKIPSNRLFWLFIRRAIEEDPVGSQAPPLFMLSDSITKDSMMMNQSLFHDLVVKYEEQGAGDAAAQQRLLEDDGGDRQDLVRDPSFGESRRSANGVPLRAGVGGSTAENESFLFGLPSFLGFSGLGNSFNPKHMHMPQASSQNSPSIAPRNASMVPAGFGSNGGGFLEDSFALPPSTSSTQYPLGRSAQYTNNSTAQQRLPPTGSPHLRQATMASPPPAAVVQGARGGPTPATSSLLTVTVTASTGQLRTFRASQQFWDHVLLEYHNMLERQMHAAMDVSPRNDKIKKAPTSRQHLSGPSGGSPNRSPKVGDSGRRTYEEENDELSLLRSAQKEEQDRLVLTVTVNTYDAQRELASQGRWLKQVSGGMHKGHGGGGGLRSSLKKALDSSVMQKQQQQNNNMTSAQMKVSFAGSGGGGANGMSPFTDPLELSGGQDDENDNDSYSGGDNDTEEAPTASDDQINRVKSVQMFVSEWRQVVDAWDTATAVLLHEDEQGGQQHLHPQTSPAKGKKVAADPLQGLVDQAEMWATRPRSAAVVDPTTTEDLVRDAMDRMRFLEQQRRSSRLGGGNGDGSGLYWTHFMNHWKVLEAQYRNYL